MPDDRRLVWDLPLRLFHWLFALTILALWSTAQLGFTWMKWHMRLGYWMIGLLLFRLIWGFVGPRHARFTSFLKGPGAVVSYARGLRRAVADSTAGPVSHVGHNPLGGLMVVVMLALVALQVSTGLFATDDITWSGPYNPAVSSDTAKLLTSVHHLNFNFIWIVTAVHIGAILYYAFIRKDNLVPPMLSGWKPAAVVPADQAITSSELWKALLVIAVSAGLVYWVLSAAPPPSDEVF